MELISFWAPQFSVICAIYACKSELLSSSTAELLVAEMPEVMEAARRAQGDASCTTGQVPSVIAEVCLATFLRSMGTTQIAYSRQCAAVLTCKDKYHKALISTSESKWHVSQQQGLCKRCSSWVNEVCVIVPLSVLMSHLQTVLEPASMSCAQLPFTFTFC